MNTLSRIMSPISVIALFAGLSEASATTVLPYLDEHTRQIYVWFLIAFPSALVLLFFLTLNFNPSALYPPPHLYWRDQNPAGGFPDKAPSAEELDIADTTIVESNITRTNDLINRQNL
jgi:hypothetical protein